MLEHIVSLAPEELTQLYADEPLIAHLLSRSSVRESSDISSYASIKIRSNEIVLFLNPEKIRELTSSEKLGLIVHEYLHILLGHCSYRSTHILEKVVKQNLSQDMIINQLILTAGRWSLPKERVLHNTPPFFYEPNLTAEEYFIKIDSEFTDEEIEELYGQAMFNNHLDWEGDSTQYVNMLTDDFFNKGGTELGETSRASAVLDVVSIPPDDQTLFWKKQIKRLASSSKIRKRKTSYKMPSKRFGFPARGLLRKPEIRLACIIDTSASIDVNYLSNVRNHIDDLSRCVPIRIIMCDSQIRDVIKCHTVGQEFEFKGGGTTNLEPAVRLAEESGFSATVIFTDGGGARFKCNLPSLWVVVNNEEFSPINGKKINVSWN